MLISLGDLFLQLWSNARYKNEEIGNKNEWNKSNLTIDLSGTILKWKSNYDLMNKLSSIQKIKKHW